MKVFPVNDTHPLDAQFDRISAIRAQKALIRQNAAARLQLQLSAANANRTDEEQLQTRSGLAAAKEIDRLR